MGTNGKEGYSSRRQQRRTLRRIMAMLGCMVAVVTCAALMAPAISMTAQTAQDQAGARLSVQEAEGVGADGAAEEPSAGEDKSGKGAAKAEDGKSAGEADGFRADGGDGSAAGDNGSSGAAPDDGEPSADNAADGAGAAEDVSDGSENGEGADAEEADAEGDTADKPAAPGSAAAQEPDGSQSFADELKDVTGKVTLSVDVEAPAGALPEGATMRLAPVKRAEVEGAVGGAMAEAAARVAEGTAERTSEFVAAEHAGAKVQSIQAVDIAFLDADGAEVEPAFPVTVKLAGPQIKRHVEGEGARSAEGVAEAAGVARDVAARPMLVHVADDGRADMVDVLGKRDLKARDLPAAAKDELVFEAGAFSVYAIVYTVDFHYEVDGEVYEYGISGGDTIGLKELLVALGAVDADIATEFVADIENVEFSDETLALVERIDADTTAGELKAALGVEPEYSAELSADDIAEMDAKELTAPDWALVSLRPFDTEEALTITMRDGAQFQVKVTDAQMSTHVITADGEDYVITVTYGPEAGIPDGATLEAEEVPQESADYAAYLEQSKEMLGIDESQEASDERPWTNEVSFARFFDISIMHDGKEIEPEAAVKVEISYNGSDSNRPHGAMDVVHFAQSGPEIVSASTAIGEDETSVSFTQESFSVTGTIINSASLGPDDYYILKEADGKWYALASDGSTVNVTEFYDPTSSSVVNYTGDKNITWEVTYGPWDGEQDGGNGWYYVKAKGEDTYLNFDTGVTGTREQQFIQGTTWANDQGIWVRHWSEQDVYHPVFGYWTHKNHYHHMLNWETDHFTFTKHTTQRDYATFSVSYGDAIPTEVRFAKVTADSDVIPGDYPNNTYNEALIQQWLEQAMTDQPLKDVTKKASIYDYDNRIYQIDFSAKSGVMAMEQDISLAFVTDVSNSMLFPSKLTEVAGKHDIEMKNGNLNSLPHDNGEVYFTIGDKSGTSTVYALYYDGGWKALDASYYAKWKGKGIAPDSSHQPKSIGNDHTPLHSKDGPTTRYTIYTANPEYFGGLSSHNIYDMSQGNMGNRLYYLESSVAGAVGDMRDIAKEYPLGAVYVALETFAGKTDNDSVKFRQDYLKIGGITNNMTQANTTYNNNYNTIYNALKSIEGQDGTRQDVALKDGTFFGSNPGTGGYIGGTAADKKYVVLITDGAPNPASHKQDVIDAANKLKQNGINVITVGLSIEDVAVAPEMLYKSASGINTTNPSDDSNEPRLFYWAKSGDDLTWILRDVVRTVMGRATVTSTITDKIDPLFYPVDKNGNPFSETSASYIKSDGTQCDQNDPGMVGKVEYQDGEWTVTWANQDIPWEGWNSSVFVKAKEDFLGGNSASTNTESSLTPISYTTNKGQPNQKTAQFANILTQQELQNRIVKPSTPYVNVDELKLTKNDTVFTVYLGEEVAPSEEIAKLRDSIVVRTVVDKDGMNEDYTIKSINDMYYDPNRPNKLTQDNNPLNVNNDPVTEIPLSHYIDSTLIDQLISSLKDGQTDTTVTSDQIDYKPYGQSKMGTITVTLAKKVNDEAKADAPGAHETQKVLNPAETYTLTVQYTPLTGAERRQLLIDSEKISSDDEGYMRSGDNGPGKEVNPTDDEVKSVNTHKVIVFAKGIRITKVDETFNDVLSGAKFELYRTARNGESGQQDLSGLAGKYVKVADFDTSSNGVATVNPVKGLKAGEKYYLVETKAPDGYNMIDHPIEVVLNVENHYYPANTTAQFMNDHEGTLQPEGTMYNWMQKATLTLAEDAAVRRTNDDGTVDMTHEGLNADSSSVPLMYYSIANNPGYELPYTGGPGADMCRICGAILVLLAGVGLLARRRMNAA